MSLPKYGIVKWRDATCLQSNKKRMDRLTKNLAVKETFGWLFEDAEGSIVVIQERTMMEGIQRSIEATVVPKAWIVNLIPLKVDENGSGSSDVSRISVPET